MNNYKITKSKSKVVRISEETAEKLERNKKLYEAIFEGKIEFKDDAIIKAALDADKIFLEKTK